MSTTRRRSIVFLTLTTLALAACGGSGATAAPGSSIGSAATAPAQPPIGETVDACALLTEEDIKDVTGFETKSSVAGPQAGIFASGCAWELIDADATVPPTISLGVKMPGGKDYYDRYFAPFNEENDYKAIDSLGDEAVDAEFGAVLVVTGDTFFQVQYIGGGFGGDDSTTLATELARWVVINLGG